MGEVTIQDLIADWREGHRIGQNNRDWVLLAALSVAMYSVLPGLATATTSPAAIDACALLTPGEVSAVVGKKVGTGQPFDDGITPQGAHSTTCIWAAPQPDPTLRLGGRGFVVLGAMNWPGGPSDASKFLQDFQKAFQQHRIDSKPVPVDVGADDSLCWGDGVAARRNSVNFGISVAQFGDRAARQPQAESVARLVVKRLPTQPARTSSDSSRQPQTAARYRSVERTRSQAAAE
jgi:hypothetical protein